MKQKRNHGNQNEAQENQTIVCFHPGNFTDGVAQKGEETNPKYGTPEIIQCKDFIVHGSHPGHERGVCSNNGKKPAHDNGNRAMLYIKLTTGLKIMMKGSIAYPGEKLLGKTSDQVIRRIAQNCR